MCDCRSDQPAPPGDLPHSIQPASYLPSAWVARFLPAVRQGGRVLDVACGTGRHLQLYLKAGLRAVGIDRNISQSEAYRLVPGFDLIEADLETGGPPPFTGERFEGVVVTNYLWRPLLPAIVDAVADAGILIYETFAAGNERFGRPRNPDFLLRPGELVSAVYPRLTVIAFEHVRLENPDRVVQRIAAVGPAHPWLGNDDTGPPLPLSRLTRHHPS